MPDLLEDGVSENAACDERNPDREGRPHYAHPQLEQMLAEGHLLEDLRRPIVRAEPGWPLRPGRTHQLGQVRNGKFAQPRHWILGVGRPVKECWPAAGDPPGAALLCREVLSAA